MSSHLKTDIQWVEVSGKGETKHQAIEQAFKEMRKKVGAEFSKPVVAIRTDDVVLTQVVKEEREEAFLFFFMKRIRETWNIQAKIKLSIDYVDFDGSEK
ncbi:DUF4312 family protein [Atopococcus tabaci]|uniref:DUF4312 family protein n=1 Tax=Atopococcus tabaci TaxID=269774 RepID=UPI000480EFCE|nr:DUF4312 family protein [Atopococcus tabaci]